MIFLTLRYRDGRFEVCNKVTDEIEGHVLVHEKDSSTNYVFVTRKNFTKHPGSSIKAVLEAGLGKNIVYSIDTVM
jgi:hypothetical protein